MKTPFWLLLCILGCAELVFSCVTEYQPDTVTISPALVVEGQITNQPGPYTVRLTRTADYTIRSINLLETGATVAIEDNAGNRETLREQAPGGVYQTRPDGIRGVVGRSYKVVIQTRSGVRYESQAEVLPAAPPIQKLYYEYSNEPIAGLPTRKQSWAIYLDTKDPDTLGNYYRWNWTHYEPITACLKNQASDGRKYIGVACCTPCWDITRCYDCLNINSDANINGKAISRQFIAEVPYTSSSKYYLEIEQQALSRGAYQFWKRVRDLIASKGGLFDTAPAAALGNVRCLTNPAEGVYGYFGATGLSEQYLNVDRSSGQGTPDLDLPVELSPFAPCLPCENSLYRTPFKPRWWTY